MTQEHHATRPHAPRRKQLLLSLVSAFMAFAIAAAVAELVLRARRQPRIVLAGWRGKRLPLSERNQLEFRGQTISYAPNDFVVALVGDSHVVARSYPPAEMPEQLLQRHLQEQLQRPVRVFTIAAAGYGQDQELLGLREYFRAFRADLVVLWFTPTNDIWNNVFPTHWPRDGTPKPTFYLKNNHLNGPKHQVAIPNGRSRVMAVLRQRFRPVSLDAYWERRFLPPAYQAHPTSVHPLHRDWEDRWPERKKRNEDLCSEKSHRSLFLVPASPRTRYGIRLTNHLLFAVKDLASSHEADFLAFMVRRFDWRSHPEFGMKEGYYLLNKRAYRISVDQFWENIDAVMKGLPFIIIENQTTDW